tara:strand:- start:425 stop:985 length:561 start_codon:yes stop_codon:yes gene_type:complete
MALTKVIGAGAEGLTLSSTDLKINAGDLIFSTADKGVVLGATSNTAANTVSDYEEGTFTATCDNSVTLHTNVANNQLAYTKIGRQVHVSGSLRINDSASGADFVINNLPFTSLNDSDIYYTSTSVRFYSWNLPNDYSGSYQTISFLGRVDPNATKIHFMHVRDNNTTVALGASDGAYIIFGITYFT